MPIGPVCECIKRDEPLVGTADETVQAVAMRMAEACCSSILLCDGDGLRGIFTERDLLMRVVAAGLDPSTTPVGQVMTARSRSIEASAPVVEAIRRMDEFCFRHMPVIDGDRIVGVVSWRDLPFEDGSACSPSSTSGTSWPSACGRRGSAALADRGQDRLLQNAGRPAGRLLRIAGEVVDVVAEEQCPYGEPGRARCRGGGADSHPGRHLGRHPCAGCAGPR